MAVNEEPNAYGMGQGCAIHGDEHMKECSMCGAEFCRICVPRSTVCPDCVEPTDEEEKDNSDFDDISHVEDVVEGEEEEDESTEDIVEEDLEKD